MSNPHARGGLRIIKFQATNRNPKFVILINLIYTPPFNIVFVSPTTVYKTVTNDS